MIARRGPRVVMVLALGLALAPALVRAEAPQVSCSARIAGGRVLVDIELADFFDAELLRLVKLGLEGRVRVDAVLERRRRLWFDERVARQRRTLVITYARPRGRFVVDGVRELAPSRPITIERLALWLEDPTASGERYAVELDAQLEVVTAQSLGKVASWIAGGERTSGVVSKNLLRTLAGDLARGATGHCEATR